MSYPMVRASILSEYAALARKCGLDPVAMLRSVAINPKSLVDPDSRLRAGKVNRLLERSADACGMMDFGLQLARTRRLSSLGALGALMRDEASVRDAIRRTITSAQLNGTAVLLQLSERGSVAMLRLTLTPDGEPVTRQPVEMAVGGLFQVLQQLLGDSWKPREVYFIHGPALDARTYRQVFGCPVHFSEEFNGLVFDSAALDQPIPLSDPNISRYAVAARALAPSRKEALSVHAVKQQITGLLPEGRCSNVAVAAALGVDRRTLHRHLQKEGLSFLRLSDNVRLDLAQQYLRVGMLSVSEAGEILGFNSLSAFSRWFSRQTGCSPKAWAASNPRKRVNRARR